MKIALVGSSGYISGFIIKRLGRENEIVRIDKIGETDQYLDLEKPDDFDYEILNNTDYVIFPAAISSPDLCEKEFGMCWNINVTGTKKFISEAIKRNNRIIFFSSDAVFGNHPDDEFDEESYTDASTAYGRMKKAIEDEFKYEKNFKAIRLSYVVSLKDKFTKYALSCIKNGEVCEVYDPFYRNCITVSDVLNCIEWLIKNWEDYDHTFLNIAGRDLIGREDIIKELNKVFDNGIKYKVVYPGEQFYSCRPVTARMKSLYLQEFNILPDESFSEKVRKEFSK